MIAPKLFPSVLVLGSVLALQAGDWPMFRGPQQDGCAAESVDPQRIAAGATPVWKSSVGTGFSSLTLVDGRVYTMGNDKVADTIWCLDAGTGQVVWKHSYPEELKPNLYEGGPNATPTVDGGRVYTLSKTGRAFCLDAAKGTVVWEKELAQETGAQKPEWGFAGSPLIVGELVIYNVGSTGAALEKATGKLVWKSGADKSGYSTPLLVQNGADPYVLIMAAKSAVAFRPADGTTVWSHPWETSYDINAADPIVSGNKVFVSSGYNHGASVFEVADGKTTVLWENKNLRNQFSSSVLWKGHLYGIDDNQLRCVDFASGNVLWSDRATGKGSLLIADGRIVALSEKGELIIAEATPEGFKPLARAQILGGKCWTVPALAQGRLYARNAKGDLVCVQVGAMTD